MTHMERKATEWLHGRISLWLHEGIVDGETAERLRARHPLPPRAQTLRPATASIAALGSAFVGFGLILIFAWNWKDFSKLTRLAISLTPLAASLALLAWSTLSRRQSKALSESAAVFNSLALAAALALIGQVYQVPGGIDTLLLPTLILFLPTLHLTGSLAGFAIYMVALVVWACAAQIAGGNATFFWVLLPAALPPIVSGYRAKSREPGHLARVWLSLLALSICLGVCLEKILPGLWIVVYSSFFALVYLAGYWPASAESDGFLPGVGKPLRTAGLVGLVALAFILSYSWPWEDIGWEYMRDTYSFDASLAWVDYAVTGALFGGAAVLGAVTMIKRRAFGLTLGLLPLVAAGSYVILSAHDGNATGLAIVNAAVNLFILHAGVLLIVSGARRRLLGEVNLGAFIVALLLLLRFVFSEYFIESLLARGIAFVATGVAFLAMNLILARVFGRDGTESST